jgi:hypothetical protein
VSPKPRRRLAFRALAVAVTTASLAGGGLVALASSANAASDPLPWMSTEKTSGEQVGTLSFYDGSGHQIFSGTLNSTPFAKYAVASGGVIAGSSNADGATAYMYTPNSSDPALWGNTQASTTAPLGSGVNATYTDLPASIRNSDREVVPLGLSATDATSPVPSTYPAPNDKVYELRVLGATDQKWYSADIELDPGANTWTQVYPTQATASPDNTALTISKAAKIASGKTVTITGTIKDSTTNKAIANATVSLYAKPTGKTSYSKVKDVKSSSSGALSAKSVKPTKTTTYEWRYAGTATHKSAVSKTDVITVSRTATIAASPKSIKKGKSTKLYGVVAPVAGGTATVQKKSGSKWLSAGHATIKKEKLPNGKTAIGYIVSVKGTAKGKFTYRVSVSGVTGYAAVVSTGTSTVTVS